MKEFDGLVADQSSQLEQLLRRYVASRRPAAIPAPHSLPRAPSPPTQDLHRSVSDESHELSSSIHQPQHPLANLPHLEPSIEPCGPTHESTLVPIDASTITTASSSEPASSVSIAQENAHRSPLPVAPSVSHLTTTRFASPPQASTASTTVAHPFGPHLPQIHTLACSILQKSQEKVSLARNTYDQIDRQIRVLDFALAAYLVPPVGGDETSELGGESSQYASRSLASTLPISGATGNVAAIIAAAQAARQRERGDEGGHPPSEPAQGNTSARALGDFKELSSLHALDITGEPSRNRSKQTSGKRKHRKSVPAVDQVEEVAEPIEAPPDFDPAGVDAGTTRLEGMKVDPNEPRYCYCKDVSYGTVRLLLELLADIGDEPVLMLTSISLHCQMVGCDVRPFLCV